MNNGIGFIGMVERPFDKSDFVFENPKILPKRCKK
jgi:hypothetical protein